MQAQTILWNLTLSLLLALSSGAQSGASQNEKRRRKPIAKASTQSNSSRRPASVPNRRPAENPHFDKGQKFEKEKRYDLALESYKESNRPPNVKALVAIGKVQMKRRYYLEAIRAYELALQMEPKRVANLVLLSEAYLAARKDAEAAAKLRAAIQIDSEYRPAHKALVAMFEDSRYERRTALEEMLAIFPKDSWATSQLCRTLAEDNFFEKALTVCADAILLSPKTPENQVYLGLMNKGSVNQKKGINMLVATAKKFPQSELAQISAGQAMDEIKNWEESARFYKAATKTNPKSAQGWIGLAIAYYYAGSYKKSIDAFLKACPLDPKAFNEVQRVFGLVRTQDLRPWTEEYRKLMDRCTYQR